MESVCFVGSDVSDSVVCLFGERGLMKMVWFCDFCGESFDNDEGVCYCGGSLKKIARREGRKEGDCV